MTSFRSFLNRRALFIYRVLARTTSSLEFFWKHDPTLAPTKIGHGMWPSVLLELVTDEDFAVLEVGSREVTGPSIGRTLFQNCSYTGFDFHEGRNVDVKGDAHRLSSFFPHRHFDLIFSTSCFEHFAMPWIVAHEMMKLVKVGGHIFVETHFSYSAHERPWHFFQFSDMALKVLFPEQFGFKCIDAGLSNPMVGRFSKKATPELRYQPVGGLYCHAGILVQKIREVPSCDWQALDLRQLVGFTQYPAPDPVPATPPPIHATEPPRPHASPPP